MADSWTPTWSLTDDRSCKLLSANEVASQHYYGAHNGSTIGGMLGRGDFRSSERSCMHCRMRSARAPSRSWTKFPLSACTPNGEGLPALSLPFQTPCNQPSRCVSQQLFGKVIPAASNGTTSMCFVIDAACFLNSSCCAFSKPCPGPLQRALLSLLPSRS